MRKNEQEEIVLYVVTFYNREDEDIPAEEYLGGDYYCVGLYGDDKQLIQGYGDYYHDKGQEKLEGFINGRFPLLAEEAIYNFECVLVDPYEAPKTLPEQLFKNGELYEFI